MSDGKKWAGRWRQQICPLAGFLSGLLLMSPGIFPTLAPIQVIALVPLLVALRRIQQWRECLHTGFLMGLAFVAPQILLLRLPPLISLVLVVYFLILMMVFVVVSWSLVRPTSISGCFAFGSLMAVLDWLTVTTLPMWGTAQSFVRCWSSYPKAIAFTSVTGMPGVMFVLGATQALAVAATLERRHRLASLVALVALVGTVVAIDSVTLGQKPFGRLRVAAVGWVLSGTVDEADPGTPDGFRSLYAEPVAEAAGQGARLVVSPETAFAVFDENDRDAFAEFLKLSRQHDVYLAVGYVDIKSQRNRTAFIGPTEGITGRYTKTYLTPFESNPKGRGDLTLVTVDGVSVGAMICHDDNYTEISRRYGAQPAGIVVVPTNDWGTVRRVHLQSCIHRAIESRFAIVRAASDGISAIISATGDILASRDHFKDGPGLIAADVSVYDAQTIFSRFGHWFVIASGFFLLFYIARGRIYLPCRAAEEQVVAEQ